MTRCPQLSSRTRESAIRDPQDPAFTIKLGKKIHGSRRSRYALGRDDTCDWEGEGQLASANSESWRGGDSRAARSVRGVG